MGAGCSGAPHRRAGVRKVAGPSGARLPGFKSSFRNIRCSENATLSVYRTNTTRRPEGEALDMVV